MKHDFLIRPITAEETYVLRRTILRPNQPMKALKFPGDMADDTFHAGAFLGNELVAVASAFHESPPFNQDVNAWRFRGMAIVEKVRRMGCGSALLNTCMEFITQQGGVLVWCNSRTYAIPFYQSLGFVIHGEEFDIATIGPHYLMWRPVNAGC